MQNQDFQQQGFDPYNQEVEDVQARKVLRSMLRSPLLATAFLLIAAAVFTGVLIFSYGGGETEPSEVPVIKSHQLAYKERPTEPGGMDIAHEDSTIYDALKRSEGERLAKVENLLDIQQEMAEDESQFSSFAREAQDILDGDVAAQSEALVQDSLQTPPSIVTEQQVLNRRGSVEASQEVVSIEAKPKAKPVRVSSKVETPDAPDVIHPAGSSPETLAFVRSVLEKNEGAVKPAPEKIEPAAGAAIRAGGFYVQLGSVPSEAGAHQEWERLSDQYQSELGISQYRVQRAELGDRGTFFRIQAGPVAKDDANRICDSIKARKPGACLVVK